MSSVLREIVLQPLEPQQRFGERLDPARLDERLARQAQQAIQVLRRHAQHAVGRAPRARRRSPRRASATAAALPARRPPCRAAPGGSRPRRMPASEASRASTSAFLSFSH